MYFVKLEEGTKVLGKYNISMCTNYFWSSIFPRLSYLWFNEIISKCSRLKNWKKNHMISKLQSIFQKGFGPIVYNFFFIFLPWRTRRSPSSCNISDKANRDRARQKISLREYLKVLKSRQHYKSSRDTIMGSAIL